MSTYSFPEDLYVKVVEVPGQGVKAEIYRRIEKKDEEVLHMQRVGLIWLRGDDKTLEGLAERLEKERSWDSHS